MSSSNSQRSSIDTEFHDAHEEVLTDVSPETLRANLTLNLTQVRTDSKNQPSTSNADDVFVADTPQRNTNTPLPHIAVLPSTPSLSPATRPTANGGAGPSTARRVDPEPLSMSRRRKLDCLRREMVEEFLGQDEQSDGVTPRLNVDADGVSEATSLSSWGHQFLIHNDVAARTDAVQAMDSQSTRAVVSPLSPTNAIPPVIPPPPVGGHLPIKFAPILLHNNRALPAHSQLQPQTTANVEQPKSFSSHSTSASSSKSATLENKENDNREQAAANALPPSTGHSGSGSPMSLLAAVRSQMDSRTDDSPENQQHQDDSKPHSKSSSLDRALSAKHEERVRNMAAAVQGSAGSVTDRKHHSLTRDQSSLSSDVMYSFDASDVQSQHAVEVVEQVLTQSLLKHKQQESTTDESVLRPPTSPAVAFTPQNVSAGGAAAQDSASPAAQLSVLTETTSPELQPIASPTIGVRPEPSDDSLSQPDIIVSNTVRAQNESSNVSSPSPAAAAAVAQPASSSTPTNIDDDKQQQNHETSTSKIDDTLPSHSPKSVTPTPPVAEPEPTSTPAEPPPPQRPPRTRSGRGKRGSTPQTPDAISPTQGATKTFGWVPGGSKHHPAMQPSSSRSLPYPISSAAADLVCLIFQPTLPEDSMIELHHSHSQTSTLGDMPFDNMDPISLQVIRRMSLKKSRTGSNSRVSHSTMSERSSLSSYDPDSHSVTSRGRNYFRVAGSKAGELRRWIGKTTNRVMHRAVNTARKTADGVSHKLNVGGSGEQSEDENPSDEDELGGEGHSIVRARHPKKGPVDFEQLRMTQKIKGEHSGAIWCVKFSLCGRLLATGGQDNMVRVWVLKDHYDYFAAMRDKYNVEADKAGTSTANLSDALMSLKIADMQPDSHHQMTSDSTETGSRSTASTAEETWSPFAPKPFVCYRAHTADVLDLSWSKNYFILSSSMDRTVRLWHISRGECLCVFQHVDFVTSIAFLPKDDRYFLSGSLDGKLRLWHIPDKKVALWNEVEGANGGLITALAIAKNGKFAVIGTFDGRCVFYTTEQLKYHTVIDVRSSRGKNARGSKVTGLAVSGVHGDKLLVTTNDSRVRLYDLRDLSLTCKYKGASNYRSQIKANFSPTGRHIVCGSEDHFVYLWRTSLDSVTFSVRKDRNGMWERVRGHESVVTGALFAPKPELIFDQVERARARVDFTTAAAIAATSRSISAAAARAARGVNGSPDTPPGLGKASVRRRVSQLTTVSGRSYTGDVIVSVDFSGVIMVFVNRTRLRTGASTFFAND